MTHTRTYASPSRRQFSRSTRESERVSLCLSVIVAMSVPLKDACTRSETTRQRQCSGLSRRIDSSYGRPYPSWPVGVVTMGCRDVRLGLWEPSTKQYKQSMYLFHLPLLSSVQFLQLVCIFTELVPKVLLDVLTHHITLSNAFQKKFGKKPWDSGQNDREWLASVMTKNPQVQNFSCKAVREKPASEWDVTNLSAALTAVNGGRTVTGALYNVYLSSSQPSN